MRFVTSGPKEPGMPVGPKNYVIRPTRRNMVDGMPEIRYGLRAEFRKGVFDSLAAQATYGWTDADRELVERMLIQHGDFGVSIYLDSREKDGRKLAEELRGVETADDRPFKDSPRPIMLCIAEGVGDNPLCGKETLPGSEFCPEHAAVHDPAAIAAAQAAHAPIRASMDVEAEWPDVDDDEPEGQGFIDAPPMPVGAEG